MQRSLGLWVLAGLPLLAMGQGMQFSVAFETLDADGNGRIDREEAREESRLYVAFLSYDTDGDGALSKREYQRFLGPRARPPVPER